MRKKRYVVFKFPECHPKNRIAFLTKQLLEELYNVFQMFPKYDDESYGLYPRWILHNMTANNENIFGPRFSDLIPPESILDQEPSSPLLEMENSYLPRKKRKFDDETNEDADRENIKPTTAFGNSQDRAKFRGTPDMLNLLPEDEETDADEEISVKEGVEVFDESEENIRLLLKNDSIHIKSLSILLESKHIGVEIDICLAGVSSGNANSSDKAKGKTNSSYICSSKHMETTGTPHVSCSSLPTINFSNPIIMYFLAQRLLSIFSYRKMCMKEIHDFFKKCLYDVVYFNIILTNLKMMLLKFPIGKNGDFSKYHLYKPDYQINKSSDDPKKMQNDLINEAQIISEKVQVMMRDVKIDIAVWEKCLLEIDDFVEEQRQLFDVSNGTNITIADLKRLDLSLKEICKQADGTLISNDERRATLLNLSSDLERLVRNLVKFLIITGILKLSSFYNSENDQEKNKQNNTFKCLRI